VEVLEGSFSLLLLRPRSLLVEFTAITLLLELLFPVGVPAEELFVLMKRFGVEDPDPDIERLPFTLSTCGCSRIRDDVEESADCLTVLTDKSSGDSRLTPTIFSVVVVGGFPEPPPSPPPPPEELLDLLFVDESMAFSLIGVELPPPPPADEVVVE